MKDKTCPNCGQKSGFYHQHDCAHGIAETHMVGTERYECKACKYKFFKTEGELHGFKYICDVTRR